MLLALMGMLLPANAADKDSAFMVNKKSFKKQYRTIALTPVYSDPLLKMPEHVGVIIEEEITNFLQKRGYTVIPTSVLAEIRKSMETQVGGFEDPETGSVDSATRANAIWKQLLQEYTQPELDPAIDDALVDYVERRKQEHGSGKTQSGQ